ncbi:hypothetical protein F4809DRAFT_559187 [Biscogniauxia mediterranea]|nr:hypothetical protein F4809DRAFT_559187 [Biscogniauxia mediterranea]
MTRTLPWKRNGDEATKPSRSEPSRSRKTEDQASDGEDCGVKISPATRGKVSVNNRSRHNRSSSTSPPPEPLQEHFMIDGPDHDDRYRMVEDELLSTAKQFTAHLHAAEYQRLKAASRSENAETIKNISRPVVGRMTDVVKKKQERKARLERQKLATRKALANKGHDGDSTDSEDSPWRASLYGLMESPRKKAASLDGLITTTTTTRAAAGFTRSNHQASTRTSAMTRPVSDRLSSSRPRQPLDLIGDGYQDGQDNLGASISKPTSKPTQASGQEMSAKPTQESDSSDSSQGDFISRLQKRQAERTRAREQRKSTGKVTKPSQSSDNIVPSFL